MCQEHKNFTCVNSFHSHNNNAFHPLPSALSHLPKLSLRSELREMAQVRAQEDYTEVSPLTSLSSSLFPRSMGAMPFFALIRKNK